MDTSGLMIVALTADGVRILNEQFRARIVCKRYEALLDGHISRPALNTTREDFDPSLLTLPHGYDERVVEEMSYISLPIAPHPDYACRPLRVVDETRGQSAATVWRVLSTEVLKFEDKSHEVTRVELFPLTGRSHQLRVHCASREGIGHAILGDVWYGSQATPNQTTTTLMGLKSNIRLMLHASWIRFLSPDTGEWVEFTSNAPF
eukprot:c4607_g1_i2.p1 GENE.c4607_g1_i2~~c4607_g1_i2.p1  ORF type:complete len:205 (-),score=37.75 c4607_g1_i2:98-712(-)